jgi:predicted membrane protein
MEAGIIAATIVATRVLSAQAYLWANVAYSMAFAVAGGYLTAALTRHRGTLHGALLAVLIVGLALLAGAEAGRSQPRWYPAVLTFGSAAAAVFGGYLCSRLRRHHSSGHYRGLKRPS